jgi:hypothetical protein
MFFRRGVAMQVALLASAVCAVAGLVANGAAYNNISVWVTLIVYVVVWFFESDYYVKLMVRQQLAKEWKLYSSNYETASVKAEEFTWLDLNYYDAKQAELESLGFKKIDDIESLHQSNAFPETRTFCRTLIDSGQAIVAEIEQMRFVEPKSESEKLFDLRSVYLGSEFSDGSFLVTNNALGINPIQDVDGIVVVQLPPDTSVEKLLDAHEDKIESICESNGVDVVLYRDVDEMTAGGERKFWVFKRDRQKKGGFTEDESTRLFADNDDETSKIYREEYARQAGKYARRKKIT